MIRESIPETGQRLGRARVSFSVLPKVDRAGPACVPTEQEPLRLPPCTAADSCGGAHGLCEKEREKNTKSTHQWEMSVYLAVHTCKTILGRSTKPGVVACTEAVVGDEY